MTKQIYSGSRDLFSVVKSRIPVREAAEHYGITPIRNRMALCPFHDDHNPSLLLTEDHFYCFGCQASGDVIDFTARLFRLRPYEAARKLAEDFGFDPNHPPTQSASALPQGKKISARQLRDYVTTLSRWKHEYAPKNPDDILDERFVQACRMLPAALEQLDELDRREEAA